MIASLLLGLILLAIAYFAMTSISSYDRPEQYEPNMHQVFWALMGFASTLGGLFCMARFTLLLLGLI